MPGQAIGISLLYGYPGSLARGGDNITRNRAVKSTDETGPSFGDPVVLNSDGTWSKFGAANTAVQFAGVAIREVKQASVFPATGYSYEPGQPCDVLERGTVSVICQYGTPVPGGTVYIRVTANGSIPGALVGGFEATADGGNSVALTNAQWDTGKDANMVAQLTILTRQRP